MEKAINKIKGKLKSKKGSAAIAIIMEAAAVMVALYIVYIIVVNFGYL
ncbi:MAG: hypothetical protein PWP15_586 [Methanothermococcus sp.]|jgi:hypothetical protein|nr:MULTISPECIES: hypothetical protein [Methanothermococcus]MDK2790079.1 hypothetical protein [Methanothermococcus sp.]MDK2987987.1 hypothetical protein [Methanothermococcus sp.]